MAFTFTSPWGTDPPHPKAATDEQEKATTHTASKRKPEADGEDVVDDNNITKSNTMMANIAKTARGPNGPVRGSDTSSPPKTPARNLVSIDLTFNTDSV
jgi:hypothetical protein